MSDRPQSPEFQVTYWRDLPSMVVAREGEQVTKVPLAGRFQAAIDEAAEAIANLDRAIEEIASGEMDIPTEPTGELLQPSG